MNLPWKGSRIAMISAAARGRRFRFILCLLSILASVGFSFLNPQIIRHTIDSVIGNEALAVPDFLLPIITRLGGIDFFKMNMWICAVLVLAAGLCSGLCNVARRYISIELGESIAWKLRNTLYGHIQRLPYDWHVSCQTGDIIQRCTTDVDAIRNFIQNPLNEFFRTFCVFIIALFMMLSMDVFMSLVALALIPIMLVFSIIYFRRVSKEFTKADEAEGAMQAAAQENYTGVRVVRAFAREAYEMNKFSERTKNFQDIWIRIGKMLGIFWGTGDFLAGFQLAIIVSAGVYRCVQGYLSPGTFLAFYTYCNWMIWPIRQLGRILSDLSRTMVASSRVREILAVECEEDPVDAQTPVINGRIKFQNVSFSYRTKEAILQNVSFTLEPGKSLAILGATGSGKSTLVHLLSRLYDLKDDEGLITIDGIDIRKISRPHLRRHVGLCLQEPFLFSKTIQDNIAVIDAGMDLEEVRAAAAVAMVDESIQGFTEGYQTIVGERGVTLSGGQKQRVSIARMLAGNPRIMIFDDSLSAVDTETDAKIRSALKERVKDAAVIIISHRISSLMQADTILVLKDGTVEALGSHQELLNQEGSYRRIFDLQQGLAEEI
ncbi:MAG: ABC transporter ATP-binding protein/permease [Treponema sp.]|nr:ABC transporter ATP-binding protein/permease [Treponema sp.]